MSKVFAYGILLAFCLITVYGCQVARESTLNDQSEEYSVSRADLLVGLKSPNRKRPVIAIIGSNEGAETTDYLIPYGVLSRADIADVYALGTRPGPIKLMPALTIQPDSSSRKFDVEHPDGADYVIVPAMHDDDDPETVAWIQQQADKGAIIVGICSGAKVLGNAGLLKERFATTHWYDLKSVQRDNPTMRYVADKRYVFDDKLVTTTGVTASIPMSLTLVEAIAGQSRAASLAEELGVQRWDDQHDSSAFRATRGFYTTAAVNTLSFWKKEKLDVQISDGVDEIALALTADAWSRTYRSKVQTRYAGTGHVVTKNGARILPDEIGDPSGSDTELPALSSQFPARTLIDVLSHIADRYNQKTADFVALQLEYNRTENRH